MTRALLLVGSAPSRNVCYLFDSLSTFLVLSSLPPSYCKFQEKLNNICTEGNNPYSKERKYKFEKLHDV